MAVQSGQTSLYPDPDPNDPFAAIGGGVRTANGGWVPKGHPDAVTQAAPAPAPAPSGQAPTPAAPGQGANTPVPAPGQPAPAPTTINDAFRQALIGQLNQPVGQVNQAELKPQVDAYRLAQQRGTERAQNQLAEQHALEGTNTSGGFLSDRLGLEQGRAESEGAFEATLIGQQFQQQYARLSQALQLAQQYGSQQDVLALQQQLALLDDAYRKQALAAQTSLGGQDLALRRELGQGQLGLGRDQLGLSYAQLQAELNRQALLAALGG